MYFVWMEIKHETTSVLYIKEPKDFEVTLEVTVTFLPISLLLSVLFARCQPSLSLPSG